jgi:L-fucose mutarotase
MLKTRLLHPEILAARGAAGHGAQLLIADANHPLLTRSGATARRVYLNLAPGEVTVADLLALLPRLQLEPHGSLDFHGMARSRDVALAVSTGDQRIYANILLAIGVRLAGAGGHTTGGPPAVGPVTGGEP